MGHKRSHYSMATARSRRTLAREIHLETNDCPSPHDHPHLGHILTMSHITIQTGIYDWIAAHAERSATKAPPPVAPPDH